MEIRTVKVYDALNCCCAFNQKINGQAHPRTSIQVFMMPYPIKAQIQTYRGQKFYKKMEYDSKAIQKEGGEETIRAEGVGSL